MRRLLVLGVMLAWASAAFGQYTTSDINYDNVSNPESLTELLRDLFENYTGTSVLFTPQTSAPVAAEGKVYYNDTANILYVCTDGSTWTSIDVGSGTSLDNAYDLGSKIDVDGLALELEVDDGSNNSALYIDHDEATNDNPAFVIENAADASTAVSIQIDGTAGYDIQGTGDTWEVSIAGALTTSGGFTIEAADCLWDDTYDLFLDTSKDLLLANDSFTIGWGGASGDDPDVGIKWNGTNLLIEAATDNTGAILLGSTNSMDLGIYGSTNTNLVTFDVSEAIVESNGWTWVIQDDDNLNFGDSDEFQIEYDEDSTDNLIIVAANANDAVQIGDGTTGTDFICQSSGDASAQVQFDASGDTNNGQWLFGADDHGIDAIFYGATASQKVWWDQSADTWYFGADAEGVDVYLYADTTGDYFMFDESDEAFEGIGVQVHLDDDSDLQVGTDKDFSIDSDTAKTLDILPGGATDDYIVNIGLDQSGVDLKLFAATTGDYLLWDATGASNLGALIFEDAVLQFAGANVTYSTAISTDALALTATDHANAKLTLGATGTNGLDVVWQTHTAGAEVTFDGGGDSVTFDGADIVMNDNDIISFGDSAAESSIASNGSLTGWDLNNGGLRIGDGGTSNYSAFAQDTGLLTFAGTARPTKRKYIPAQAFTAIAGSPVLTTEVGTNIAIGWAFDAAAEEGVATTFEVPHDWASGTDVSLYVYWCANDTTAAHNVVWDVNTVPLASDEDVSGGTIVVDSVTDTLISGTAYDLNVSQAVTIGASTEWAAGDMVSLILFRDGDNGSDDVSADAIVFGVAIAYTSDEP